MSSTSSKPLYFWPLIATAIVLLVPFTAGFFSEGVNWSLFDYVVGGVVIFSFSMAIAAVLKSAKIRLKFLAVAAIVVAFVLLWAEMAVGIFGSPIAGS